MEAAAAYKIAI